MSVLAVVPAAGDGTRLAAGMAKALVRLGGVPLVVRAVDGLLDSGSVDAVVVAVREVDLDLVRTMFAGRERVDVVVGGSDRTSSVRAALERGLADYPTAHTILVHDAARALTPVSLVAELVAAVAAGSRAVVPVLPLADTVKEVEPGGGVRATVDRSVLRAVQTPQAFEVETLRRAYAAASEPGATGATDDAGLVERLGEPVRTIPGDPLAFKITTPWDLRLAEMLMGAT
ncbi:MAG TPA: 2-C-methyl-D-erythritol 4-phosphate cytidylyltransferase [Pseudonocardia sp.]|nr:2-C-methyl-D-erythritol 4-phosphate cytidylyltransferase [Pseudonocardia sp.]